MSEQASGIERLRGKATGRNAGTAYGDFVWVATIPDRKPPSISEQSADIFSKLDHLLAQLGSNKKRILSATVYLSDLNHKSAFDEAWCTWIGEDSRHWPQRTCVGAQLFGETLVEIMLLAIRDDPNSVDK
ncbi:Rid family hydrolase [Bradyrhizobium sp. CB3481]|uniref:Rid family hydrolase n=1 Tax=Bradyrhizobium sp. CB3481 TaxID=3039158 RepID=UPI0024B11FDB|nr:Rid family hydrolase [Bradyrhizobium sp. CB3481]WFU14869.1 Rid family hydrolase [Bradyrhizobium sp. CB3481]